MATLEVANQKLDELRQELGNLEESLIARDGQIKTRRLIVQETLAIQGSGVEAALTVNGKVRVEGAVNINEVENFRDQLRLSVAQELENDAVFQKAIRGEQGQQGEHGDRGATGDSGPQGDPGRQGPTGAKGKPGPAGENA